MTTAFRVLALALGLGTIYGILLANQGDLLTIRQVSRYIPGGDAGLHLVVMGALMLFLSLGFEGSRVAGRRVGTLTLLVVMWLFATGEEFQQMHQPYRRFSLVDLFFSYLGIGVGASIAILIRRVQRWLGSESLR